MKMFSTRTFISRSSRGGREKSLTEFSAEQRRRVIRGRIDGGLNLPRRERRTFLETPEQRCSYPRLGSGAATY